MEMKAGNLLDLGLGHRYRLEHLMARSTCGDVWLASWEHTGMRVTIKTVRSDVSAEDLVYFREALTAEGDHLRRLNHRHIVGYQRAGRWQGSPVLVMEQLDLSLAEWLKQQGGQQGVAVVPEDQALAWTNQLASALVALHRSGRKHLDLKPGNVLLTPVNARGSRTLKLADFGVCMLVERVQHRWVGTPGWAAPEQMQSVGRDEQGFELYATSTASDWYALGQLLHRMLYGRLDEYGEHAWRTFDPHVPADDRPASQPTMHFDDAPTRRAFAGEDGVQTYHPQKTPQPQAAAAASAAAAPSRDAGAQEPVHRLLKQLLSHDPQDRLLAAQRWLNRSGQ